MGKQAVPQDEEEPKPMTYVLAFIAGVFAEMALGVVLMLTSRKNGDLQLRPDWKPRER